MRRAVILLFAGLMAALLGSVAVAGPAVAAGPAAAPAFTVAVPPSGVFSEIFPPFISARSPICLDEPGGSAKLYLQMQLYHCHGYASNGGPQRWFWQPQPALGSNVYRILSADNHTNPYLCLGVFFGNPGPGSAVVQAGCTNTTGFDWVLVPSAVAPHFQLQLLSRPSLCLAAADTSGANDTKVVVHTCVTPTVFYEPPDLTWQIG
ncbi:RICIN domain-containing protein [Dactylosporangium sp. CS-047395]|uniref:RICIN domain-containing protein n=1 Tax=Dactylosporangium sp. CS-047395 TaxID=3239936 RepID=UPI003D8DF0A4